MLTITDKCDKVVASNDVLTLAKSQKGDVMVEIVVSEQSRRRAEEVGISDRAVPIGRIEEPDPYTVWQDILENGFVLFGKVWDKPSNHGNHPIREVWDAVGDNGLGMTSFGRKHLEVITAEWLRDHKRRRVNGKKEVKAMINRDVPLTHVLIVAEQFRPVMI